MRNANDKLNGGSRVRLARYRRALEKSLATIRGCRTPEAAEEFIASAGYTSPLNHRYNWHSGDAHGPTFSEERGGFANIPTSVLDGLRDCGAADRIISLRHTGWYRDAHCSETYAGHVWQLPARNGEPQYLAGYVDADAGYSVLDVSRGRIAIFSDKEDAARAADELARIHAEHEKEHNERWQEAHDKDEEREEAREELRGARQDARVVVKAFRDGGGTLPESVAEILAERFETAREEMHDAIKKIHECTDAIETLDMSGEF